MQLKKCFTVVQEINILKISQEVKKIAKNKVINTILNLKDNMSGGIVKTSKKVAELDKTSQKASKQITIMANNFKKKVSEIAVAGTKISATAAGIAGAFAFKIGLGEAMNLEGYKMQLETATKDTKKATDIMKYSIDLANRTPFEGGSMVEGAAKFEAMGMSAKKWLPLVGDMAAATNKNFDQAVEALIDAQTGELERLKEFGITKIMIAEQANKMFANEQIINNKGQIVNQEKFNEAMVELMKDKFTGGMEKQSKTMKGLLSTVTGVTKSALANMIGITSEGTIRTGSILDKLKLKVQQLADKFAQWQQDGTLDRIASEFTRVFEKIYNTVSSVFTFINKNKDIIITLGSIFAGFAVGIKVVTMLKSVIVGLQVIWGLFNGTLALTPLGWIVIGITAIIAVGVALYKNWDTIKSKAIELYESVLNNFIIPFKDMFLGMFEGVKEGFKGFANFIIGGLNNLIDGFNNFASFKIPEWVPGVGGKGININIPKIPTFALGTSYFKGGLAQINERGGEILNLPNGTKVIPSDKSDKIINNYNSKNSRPIIININAVNKDTDEIVNEMVPKIILALENV